jgi:hypothetical protein
MSWCLTRSSSGSLPKTHTNNLSASNSSSILLRPILRRFRIPKQQMTCRLLVGHHALSENLIHIALGREGSRLRHPRQPDAFSWLSRSSVPMDEVGRSLIGLCFCGLLSLPLIRQIPHHLLNLS